MTELSIRQRIETKLNQSRQELLDLGLRNTLINYRTLRSRGVEIIDEHPEHVFRILVNEERKMSFLHTPEDDDSEEDSFEGEEQDVLLEQPDLDDDPDAEPAERHVDNKLQTPYTSKKLQDRLLSTFYYARRYIEEQGVSILYMALGMLEWREPQSNEEDARRAPLILIPVELSRTSVRARFRVTYTGEGLGDNLSLQHKMKAEFGISLPSLPESVEDIDVSAYFDDVEQAVESFDNWQVDRTAVVIGFFSFNKFLMYNDLDPENWPEDAHPADHATLRSLLMEGFDESAVNIPDDDHLDEHLHPDDAYHVVDADSSQSLAILDVNAGHNLVIQGPPGTGKSQTITNIIADALAHDQTVLFVSEKMAALEVVKRRLDAIDLGDACLELHSHNTRKKAVLEELERTLYLGQPKIDDHQQNLSLLQEERDRLNEYCNAVNTPVGESGVTPYRAYGELLHLRTRLEGVEAKRFDISGMAEWTAETYARRESAVETYQALLAKMGTPDEHPFWGSTRELLLTADESDIADAAAEALEATRHVRMLATRLADTLGVEAPKTRDEIEQLCTAGRRAADAPDLSGINVDSELWTTQGDAISEVLAAGQQYDQHHDSYDDVLIPEAWEQDVLEIRQHLAPHVDKMWLLRILSGDFRSAKSQLAGLCSGELPDGPTEWLQLADAILEVQRAEAKLEKHEEIVREALGERWDGLNSDWERLIPIAEWVNELYADVQNGTMPAELIPFLQETAVPDDRQFDVDAIEKALERQDQAVVDVIVLVQLNEDNRFSTGETFLDRPLAEQEALLEAWSAQTDRLQEMVSYNHRTKTLVENDLDAVAEYAKSWGYGGTHLVDLFQFTWYNALIERALNERPILASFDRAAHENTIQRFGRLDELSFLHNRAEIALSHFQSIPSHGAAGQMGVLRHEFQKKRRHLPIRKLIQEAGRAIRAIKPVFMMSPLSIATYLPPGSVTFDVVVFDEASQVTPVDAFGAILRGDQTIVVGDTKQLPPTNFFQSSLISEEDVNLDTADLESVIGLFKSQGAPERTLRFHYRSRHESLITVSNREFYENRLITFPSPDAEKQQYGLIYHHLPDTVYDRGGSSANRKEAQFVADAVMEHARTRPRLTLGVATMNSAQMDEIQHQLELRRRQDPSCESFFNAHPEEPFFVKNLENVQGDERDIIFISIGYGRDANGFVSMNFGPINRDGGERRLNVLFTRARRRCEVFTNLQADDIDLSRTNSRGVEVLKRYLEYAQTGELELPTPSDRGAESPFEEAVARALRQNGYQVVHQVGTAGFFVDLAIVDPEAPGRYLLGIECDGATYHSARTARVRDRIRQNVLEDLGWNIHRIWSTDWFRHEERETKRAIRAIESAKAENPGSNGQVTTSPGHLMGASIERHAAETDMSQTIEVPQYTTATLNIYLGSSGLHEVATSKLASWLNNVVEVESPVHTERAARTIMDAVGVTRLGRRIRESFDDAVRYGVNRGWFNRQGDFLFEPGQEEISVRDRSALDNSARKIEFIAPAEIATAVEMIVEASFGIDREEAAQEVCRLFGFSRTSENMREQVVAIIEDMLMRDELCETSGHLMLE